MDRVAVASAASQGAPSVGRAPTPPRKDLYGPVHKGMRLRMTDVLVRLGATDFADDASVRQIIGELGGVLDVCALHLRLENAYLHEAVERRRPGAMARLDAAHEDHEHAIAELRACAARLERADRDA